MKTGGQCRADVEINLAHFFLISWFVKYGINHFKFKAIAKSAALSEKDVRFSRSRSIISAFWEAFATVVKQTLHVAGVSHPYL